MGSTDVTLGDGRARPVTLSAQVTVGIPTYNRSGLLCEAIESVLAQSYPHFTLVVSDNASDDDTADVVGSFGDPRLVYRPLATNIGRAPNFNRLIELAETEFVVLLGDDDKLEPDHLLRTVDAMRSRPRIGMIHTGFSVTDELGRVLTPHTPDRNAKEPVTVESGADFLDRCMSSGPQVCFSSVVFRKAALVDGGMLQPEDGVIDDLPLYMRIATRWDFAYLDESLAVMRAHDAASSSSLGFFTPRGFRQSRSVPDGLYARRQRFLREANLPAAERRRLTRKAERAYRRDVLAHLSTCAVTGDGFFETFQALRVEIRRDPRLAVDPLTWRFVVGQLGGRKVRDWLRRRR
jgi:glycosyltransferase involved in cell wall biosynthesis